MRRRGSVCLPRPTSRPRSCRSLCFGDWQCLKQVSHRFLGLFFLLHTLSNLPSSSNYVFLQIVPRIQCSQDLDSADCVKHVWIMGWRCTEPSTAVKTSREVADKAFARQEVWSTEKVCSGQAPVDSTCPEVFSEPVL